jgi:N-methylhydantoinase A
MMSVEAAKARPLSMAMSGPAGGVAAAAHTARALGLARALAFDMGGTTTDVCLIADGVPETAGQRKLGDYPARLPMVAVESIGAGGGSIARVEATGALKVGPRSAGAVPGPACYGQGGLEPTVSDANLLLGYLNPGRVYGGSIHLDPARAEAVIAPLAERFGLTLIEAAHGVVEVANANMLRALRLVSVQRGYDLREFSLIAFGGAGPLHAGAFSALGSLVSPLRYDTVQTHRGRIDAWDAKVVEERFRALEAQCLRPLLEEGHDPSRVNVQRGIDFRYVGQNYELEIGWVPGGPGPLKAAFEARHRQLYGYATGENVECVNLRVTARAVEEPLPLPPPPSGASALSTGSHRAYFKETGAVEMPRYDRTSLPPSHVVTGPAMVEDEWSTTVVYPGQRCVADTLGNLVIEVGGRA